MCQLVGVSRASYYRHWEITLPDEAEMAVRAAIHEEVLRHRRRYGSRRIAQALRRQGMVVNRKRVSRHMQEDNLLAIRYRKYIITTDSQHDCPVYLNLAARMTLTGINQLWVADITYIRLRKEFVYLAVVIDRFSRKAVGWALDRTLAARSAVAALQQAITRRQPPTGVVHHSDQGIQYACAEYAAVLQAHHLIPSMSRPAKPHDNGHRPLDQSHNLAASLSHVETRQVRNDYTLPIDAELYQIERESIVSGLRKASVRVEKRLDGSLAVQFGERYLTVERVSVAKKTENAKTQAVRQV